jgi:hypothetical protein
MAGPARRGVASARPEGSARSAIGPRIGLARVGGQALEQSALPEWRRPALVAPAVPALQRAIGNQAVGRLLAKTVGPPTVRRAAVWSGGRIATAQRQDRGAAAGSVVQRLLNAGQKGPQEARCLALEGRVDAALALVHATFAGQFPSDHPLVELIRAQLQRVRAPFGTDDDADITAKLDDYQARVVLIENNINANAARLATVGNAYAQFDQEELEGLSDSLGKVAGQVHAGKVNAQAINDFERLLQRTVAMSSKEMSKLRKTNAQDAMDRVAQYVAADFVRIDTLNSFYASSYDSARDDFGAAAGLANNTSSGSMQWLKEWEYHIHANVVRAGGPGTAVNGFVIKTGHIKPTDVARDTGTSITVPVALNNAVVAAQTANIVRWANSSKAEPVLRKQ